MTVALIVIAHDKIGTSIRDTALSLVANSPAQIQSLELYKEDEPGDFLEKAQQIIDNADQGDGVLIMTDMFGATPSNVTCKLQRENLVIISGLNLPMLIRAINYHSLNISELALKILEGGRAGIINVNGN